MNRMLRWLIPNRLDGVLLVITILLTVGYVYTLLAITAMDPESIIWFCIAPLVCAMIGIGCCLGWWQWGWRRTLTLFVIVMISPFTMRIGSQFLGWELIDQEAIMPVQWWSWAFQNQGPLFGVHEDWSIWLACFLFGTLLVSWLLILMFRYIPFWLWRLTSFGLKRAKMQFQMTRVKLLIGIAITLFVLHTVNNILIANGVNIFDAGGRGPSDWFEFVVSAIGITALFGILVAWPSWAILKSDRFWIKLCGVLTTVVSLSVFVLARRSSSNFRLPLEIEAGLLGICCVTFLLIVIGLKHVQEKLYPSIWSLLTIALTVTVLVSPAFFDFSVFFSPFQQAGLRDRFILALESGEMLWKTKGQIRGSADSFYCQFNEGSDPKIISEIDLTATPINLYMRKMHASIDTSMLRDVQKGQVTIHRCSVTSAQLQDLTSNATPTCYLRDVDVDSSQSKAVIDANEIFIVETRQGRLAQLFDSIQEFKTNSKLNVITMVQPEELAAIAKANKNCEIFLQGGVANSEFDWSQLANSLAHVNFKLFYNYGNQQKLRQHPLRLLLETNINIWTVHYYHDQGLVWDLIFALPNRTNVDDFEYLTSLLSVSSIGRDTQGIADAHLVWGTDANDNITHLILPTSEDWHGIRDLTKLKSLSFDPLWIGAKGSGGVRKVEDLNGLRSLENLEELYLSHSLLNVPSLDFLSKMTKLKRLQLSALDRSLPNSAGFGSCPSLESIIFLGKPDNQSIVELATLPNLKKVTISDVDNTGLNPVSAKKALEKRLPGVEIKIVPFGQHKPAIPEGFLEHLKKKKGEALKKLRERAGLE